MISNRTPHYRNISKSRAAAFLLERLSVVYYLQPHRQGRRPHRLANALQGKQHAVFLRVLHLGDLVQGLETDLDSQSFFGRWGYTKSVRREARNSSSLPVLGSCRARDPVKTRWVWSSVDVLLLVESPMRKKRGNTRVVESDTNGISTAQNKAFSFVVHAFSGVEALGRLSLAR